jgi:predicted phage terminase large subunit-like protein
MLTPAEQRELEELMVIAEERVGYLAAGKSLSEFVRQAWKIIEPDTDLLWNWHLDLMCEYLEEVTEGREHRLVFNEPPRYMKLCADSTPVLTPRGWTTHGELRVGDEVFTPSGATTAIVAVHPTDVADFEVAFTNGERVKCNGEHLWTVYDRTRKKWVTERTEDLMACRFVARTQWSTAGLWNGRARFQLPEVSALEYPESEQALPPYFVGAWLGDGSSSKPAITRDPKEHEVVDRIESVGIMATTEHVHPTGTSVCTYFSRQGVVERLREIGVYRNKHIPAAYKYASLEQRLELMAGLIDTDGSCDENGRITFANSNRGLVDDVIEVATGLGWKPYVIEVETTPFNGYGGGRPHFHVGFNPTHDIPVALERKRPKRRALVRRIGIRSIERCEPEPGNCITVAAEDGLYLVGHQLIPTHNSILVSVMWPCWEWTRTPALRYIFASYSASLSTDHSLLRRRIIESDWYMAGMAVWGHPGFSLSGDQNLKMAYENTYRGAMVATSVGGTVTGKGGDRIVIDDPLNPDEALSDSSRMTCNQFFDWTLSTRLNDKKNGAFVIVMQRLHTDDLTGHVLAGKGWTHVRIPCIAEEQSDLVVNFPSGRVVCRELDSLLWPEREDWPQIEPLREQLNSYGFAGQYQQRPVPLGGGIIKREYLRLWTHHRLPEDGEDVMELPSDLANWIQSWDTTYWDSAANDFCVGQVWATRGAWRFLIDQDRARRQLPSTKAAIRSFTLKWPRALVKLVERTANGAEVLRSMQGEIEGLVGVKVEGSKMARLMSVLGIFEAKQVVIPHPREASWVPDYIAELTSFPSVPHDDQVDCSTQALERLRFAVGADTPYIDSVDIAGPYAALMGERP